MNKQAIRHGGDLHNAIRQYGDSEQWLDLSTGISPWSYPASPPDTVLWRELPASHETLLTAASNYYFCDSAQVIATPGSQLAIRLIPQQLVTQQKVAIPQIGYQEHAYSWQMAGHQIVRYRNHQELNSLVERGKVESAVVINPNNPTGELVAPESLVRLSDHIKGVLVIDEAFSDIQSHSSVCKLKDPIPNNVVVLKSMGKFFGLAGARIGFVVGSHPIIARLNILFSPWSISGPSIELATMALQDRDWQFAQTARINSCASQQREIMKSFLPHYQLFDQSLFFTLFAKEEAIALLHDYLVQQKIWSRLGDPFLDQSYQSLNWLRLSLAGEHFDRLANAFEQFSTKVYLGKQL